MRPPWDEAYWRNFESFSHRMAVAARSDRASWTIIARRCRLVLRAFSSSFFLVTRFLPPAKRAQVEVVYAAVRFPDEIVDSFPLTPRARQESLAAWLNGYERALRVSSLRERLHHGIPPTLAAFAEVVLACGIPEEHYQAFLGAMRFDVEPRPFATMDDLIESYVNGSAIVVGYFLAFIYGASAPSKFPRALESSRHLGIALQLTNFLRDVGEDQRRGRVYLPENLTRAEGIREVDVNDASQLPALRRVLAHMSREAERHYSAAERNLDAFAPDCQTAIRACIDVYRQLNERIGRSAEGVRHRESVPIRAKFHVLPSSKYWKVPLALVGAL